jgi:hypothetical protein
MRAAHEYELVGVELGGNAVGDGRIARRAEPALGEKRLDSAGDERSEGRNATR